MFKFLLALSLLFLDLYACKGGYDSCVRKVRDTHTVSPYSLSIPVSKHKKIVFSQNIPNAKVLKYDPYLSLYLIEEKKTTAYPFSINNYLTLGVSAVDEKNAIEGKILKKQIGLDHFATFSDKVRTPSLLLNSCCSLEGIITSKGIIQKVYLNRFLHTKYALYSDIGIRVQDSKTSVVVTSIDPFIKNNPFKVGDSIVMLDGKKIKESASFSKKILFSKLGSSHKVKVARDGEMYEFRVKSSKRYGGGFFSDTFLESFGISFDEKLVIKKILDETKSHGLIIGDKLVQVNGKKVQTQEDVRKQISCFKESASLLFERNHFQFFLHFD